MNAAAQCQQAMDGVGAGIGASLRGVDCAASAMAQAAFNNLFSEGSSFGFALTALLTMFVALIGYGLITGRSRIGLSSITPKAFTMVAVITFATSWVAFQSVFWNLAVGAPDEIAGWVVGTNGSATIIFADKLDVVMVHLEQTAGNSTAPTSTLSPLGLMWLGGILLLLGTVGVLATCKIALAILMGLGPIFIVMALFNGTRGLFVGWLKGVVLMALAPLFAVLGGSLMLELAIPVLSSLAPTVPGSIEPRPAMAFFMIGAVHLALMFMVLKVATTMVNGWSVFGLSANEKADIRGATTLAPSTAPAVQGAGAAAAQRTLITPTPAPARDLRVSSSATPVAANDSGPGNTGTSRETRIVANGSFAPAAQGDRPAASRARGIGSRFKAAPIRSTEKVQ